MPPTLPKFGPAKWEALDKRFGVRDTLNIFCPPELSDKKELLKDIMAVAIGQAVEAAQHLIEEYDLEAFCVVTTSGVQDAESKAS